MRPAFGQGFTKQKNMSTRANIIVKDGEESMIFYRHSDGYPEGTLPSLIKFCDLLKNGPLRNNPSQGAGWLIILGALEYASIPRVLVADEDGSPKTWDDVEFKGWKVGAYEPTTAIHGDIEHLYVVDMNECSIVEIEIPPYSEKGQDQQWNKSRIIVEHYRAKEVARKD